MPRNDAHQLTFEIPGTRERVVIDDFRTVVAGYTGRDVAAVQEHIDELAALGIQPPDSVPAFYPVESTLVTQQPSMQVAGEQTSGEVEPVLIRIGDELFLTVGSDHTDRDIERESVARSKQACPKPVARQAIRLAGGTKALDWDSVKATSSVDGNAYQDGSLRSLRVPTDVLAAYEAIADSLPANVVLFGGTLPLLEGAFIAGDRWTVALELPDATTLQHSYEVVTIDRRGDGSGGRDGQAGA